VNLWTPRWFPRTLESYFAEALKISAGLVNRMGPVDPETIIFPVIRSGCVRFLPIELVIGPDHLDGGLTRAGQCVFHGG
jgi:hypothetical protein